jgi:DNA polymerase III subunit epsilon
MSWRNGFLSGLDFESTAPDPTVARVVTASVVIDTPDQVPVTHDWLVAVDEPIPAAATAIHGVTTEHAQTNGRSLNEVVREVSNALTEAWDNRIPVVIFNAPYDLTLLNEERARVGWPRVQFTETTTPILDPLVIDRAMDKYRKGSRKLADVCQHYGVTLDVAHTSAADSLAAVEVMRALVKAYPQLGSTSLQHLYRLQAVWYSQWATGLEKYFRSTTDPVAVVDRSWPVRIIDDLSVLS